MCIRVALQHTKTIQHYFDANNSPVPTGKYTNRNVIEKNTFHELFEWNAKTTKKFNKQTHENKQLKVA